MAAAPSPVHGIEEKTVLIEQEDETVEGISHDCVTYASTSQTKNELQQVVHQMTIKGLTPSAYQTCEQPNTRALHPARPLPDANGIRHITRSQSNTKCPAQTAITESSVISKPRPKVTQTESPQKTFTDRIIRHGVKDDQEHLSPKPGEVTYRVRWYGFDSDDDKFEPF